jgi:hypothetical protein
MLFFLLLLRSVILRDMLLSHNSDADDFGFLECDTLSIVKQSNVVSHSLFLLDSLTAEDINSGSLQGCESQSSA